jgi:hypothetical protein
VAHAWHMQSTLQRATMALQLQHQFIRPEAHAAILVSVQRRPSSRPRFLVAQSSATCWSPGSARALAAQVTRHRRPGAKTHRVSTSPSVSSPRSWTIRRLKGLTLQRIQGVQPKSAERQQSEARAMRSMPTGRTRTKWCAGSLARLAPQPQGSVAARAARTPAAAVWNQSRRPAPPTAAAEPPQLRPEAALAPGGTKTV